MNIPNEIQEYLDKKIDSDLALIGCRAESSKISYDCCEYDIAVLGSKDLDLGNKITYLRNSTLEFVKFPNYNQHDISLYNIIKLKNKEYGQLLVSPNPIPKVDIKRMFIAGGKRKVVDSLFGVSKNIKKTELNSSLNLKIAAYDLLEGILLISGTRPMPVHELNQLRKLEIHKDYINEAIQACIECLGIERATRTIINRSIKAMKEILKERYDVELLSSKIRFLLAHGLLADCYYYIGKLVCKHLENKDHDFQINYYKLNTIALDLTSDYEYINRMSETIKLCCKNILKN